MPQVNARYKANDSFDGLLIPNPHRGMEYLNVPKFRMPRGDTNQKSREIKSPKPNVKVALKSLITHGRAWIPGGHANSVGRNKLASISKEINSVYSKLYF
jgi:hypothetical protein